MHTQHTGKIKWKQITYISLNNSHMPHPSLRQCYFHASAYCKPSKHSWRTVKVKLARWHSALGPWSMMNFTISTSFFHQASNLELFSVRKWRLYKSFSRVTRENACVMQCRQRTQSFSKILIWLSTFADIVEHSHVAVASTWSQLSVKVFIAAAQEFLFAG